jgi:hypothetical protein
MEDHDDDIATEDYDDEDDNDDNSDSQSPSPFCLEESHFSH